MTNLRHCGDVVATSCAHWVVNLYFPKRGNHYNQADRLTHQDRVVVAAKYLPSSFLTDVQLLPSNGSKHVHLNPGCEHVSRHAPRSSQGFVVWQTGPIYIKKRFQLYPYYLLFFEKLFINPLILAKFKRMFFVSRTASQSENFFMEAVCLSLLFHWLWTCAQFRT